MSTNETSSRKIGNVKGFFIFMGALICLYWFWQFFLVLMVLSILVLIAYGQGGTKIGNVALVTSLILLVTAQLHWINGNTVCLSDSTNRYLWHLKDVDVDNVSGSIENNDDGSVSISFSASSTDNIPGANYAQVTALGEPTLYLMRFGNIQNVPKDIKIDDDLKLPEVLDGMAFYVPKNAEFRASQEFDSDETIFTVADLPVLVKIDDETYTPVGILEGNVEFGPTAVIAPADFDGRNLVLDGNRRSSNTQTNREYFQDKKANPEIVVAKMQRDWLTSRPPYHLYLHKYAEAYDCRPSAYEAIGIGWLFKSAW